MSAFPKDFTSADVAAALLSTNSSKILLDIFRSLGKILSKPKNGLKMNRSLTSAVFIVTDTHRDSKVRIAGYDLLPQLVRSEPDYADGTIILGVAKASMTTKNSDVRRAAHNAFQAMTTELTLYAHTPHRHMPRLAIDMLRWVAPSERGAEARIKNTAALLKAAAA